MRWLLEDIKVETTNEKDFHADVFNKFTNDNSRLRQDHQDSHCTGS
jgi:regulation of enolase protein 1 (concanavalin A-like superfamily)